MASSTRWPTAVDYQTALQTPALCFDDADLQQATVHTNALGLPKAATGNVAVVFRLSLDDGEYALRCFTRQGTVDGMPERYQTLNAYIEDADLDGLVPTFIREDAILVEESRYPVALMPWVPGKQIHRAIEAHLEDAEVLRELARQWREQMRYLRDQQFAHGDLSDGNILVDQDQEIHLIDYDAAYVPPLWEQPPSEIGKPNYQHPDRLASDSEHYGYYAENVDAFAALVVYLSLKAVAADPSLWDRYHTGDNLIFVQNDYKRPGHTPIWPNLRSSRDQEVRQLTETLERYCKASVAELPSLEQALRGKRPGRRRRRSADADVSKAEVDESGTISVVAHVGKEGASLTFPESPDRNGAPPRTAERSGPDQTQPPWADAADPPSNIRSDEPTSPASGRKTDAPASDPAPAPAETSWFRSWRIWMAAALVLLILAIGATIVWAPWEREEPATTEPATSETDGLDVPGEYGIAPSDLAGFYTGYNTLPDGERGSIGLEITGPARVGDTVTFSFTLNSLRYQLEGTGTFDPASGHLDLNGQYFLHARYNARDRLELSSLPPGNPNPTLRVTKTDDL